MRLWLWLWFDPSPLLTMLLPDVVTGFDRIIRLWITRTVESPRLPSLHHHQIDLSFYEEHCDESSHHQTVS